MRFSPMNIERWSHFAIICEWLNSIFAITNDNNMRTFEVILNNNFALPAYTLEVSTPDKAVKIAVKEAKANRNDNVYIIEVDDNGFALENGFSSGTIKIN